MMHDFTSQREGAPAVGSSPWLAAYAAYAAYLKSAQWRNIRRLMIEQSKGRCARCGYGSPNLEVHHKTYERLGKERMTDLEVLCRTCHKLADEERASEGRKRSQAAYDDACYTNGRNTYMTKKYGDDWERGYYDSEEFDRWLERKAYDIGG